MDRAIRICLYAILLTVPVFFDTGLYRVFVLDKVVLLRLLVSAAVSAWAIHAWRGKGEFAGRTPLDGPLLAFAGVAILSTAVSTNPRISLIGSSARQEGLVLTLSELMLFGLAARFLTERPRTVALMTCIAAGIAAGYGVVQRVGLDPLVWGDPVWGRVTSTFGQPNALGGYLGMALPLLLALGMTMKDRGSGGDGLDGSRGVPTDPRVPRPSLRVGYLASIAVCLGVFALVGATLLLTGSRGGWLGAATAIGLFLWTTWRWAGESARRVAATCLLLLSLITLGFCLNPGLSPLRRISLTFQAQPGLGGWPGGTARERWVTWRAAWGIVQDHPLTGVGPEMMREFLPRYLSPEDPETEADRAHNLFLDEAVAKGLPGVAALCWLLWRLWRTGAPGSRDGGPGAIWKGAFLSAAAGYTVQNLVGFGWPGTRSLFWVSAAIAVSSPGIQGQHLPAANQVPPEVAKKDLWFRLFLLALVLGAGANACLALASYRADRSFGRGMRLLARDDPEGAVRAARSAMKTFPLEVDYLSGLGRALHRAAELKPDPRTLGEAEQVLATAAKMDPEDGHLRSWLGKVRADLFRRGREEAMADLAVTDYREAIRRLPRTPGISVNLANLLMERGLGQGALRVCEEGVLRNPGSADLSACLGQVHQVLGHRALAEDAFRQALRLQPARSDAHQALGRMAFERGDYEAASKAFRVASELEPGNGLRRNDLGTALYRAGRLGEATEQFREALRLNPGDHYARDLLDAATSPATASVPGRPETSESADLPAGGVIDLVDPASRRFLGTGWSYTETWGTWAVGEASEVLFRLAKPGRGVLVVRATAPSSPGRPQTVRVLMNGREMCRWGFSGPLWTWETFNLSVPESVLLAGPNRLVFRFGFSAQATPEDRRPVAVAFEKIVLAAP